EVDESVELLVHIRSSATPSHDVEQEFFRVAAGEDVIGRRGERARRRTFLRTGDAVLKLERGTVAEVEDESTTRDCVVCSLKGVVHRLAWARAGWRHVQHHPQATNLVHPL